MRGALGSVPGIGDIAIKAGDKDFKVNYDSKKIKPDEIVAKLVAAGEKGAKVKA
ncbi:MAG: hypothetical protein IPK26_09760 [Planctomycetes bacterium]|nr:hypothetical protein [Planctomycetota bacterium]